MSVGSMVRHLKMEVFKGMEVDPHLWWIDVVIEYERSLYLLFCRNGNLTKFYIKLFIEINSYKKCCKF